MSSEIPKQGLVKQDNNKDDDTKEVEDTDMKDQDDIDNHNGNINCQEVNSVVDCNDKAQNTVKNEVNVNNIYERFEVLEECNNHDMVEKRNPEDAATNEEMNIIAMVVTANVL